MSKLLYELRCENDDIGGLHKEIERRNKIIASLVHQIGQGFSETGSSYNLMQRTSLLETEVRSRTAELKKSIETIEAFIENASIGIVTIRDGVIERINPAFTKLFGVNETTAIGHNPLFLFKEKKDYARLLHLSAPHKTGVKPFSYEVPMINSAKQVLWVNVIGYSHNYMGNVETVLMLDDRTLIKKQDEELKKHNKQLEARVTKRTWEIESQLHFLEQLIEAIPAPFYYKDKQLRYLSCNSAFEKLFGVQRHEIQHRSIYRIFKRQYAQTHRSRDELLLKNGGNDVYESKYFTPDGKERDAIFSKAVFVKQNDEIGGIVGFITDITEQKKMAEYQRQVSKVFENSAEGIIITDSHSNIIIINAAFTRITGYSIKDVQGKNPRLLNSGRNNHLCFSMVWEEIKTNGFWQGEIWNKKKNGEIFPCFVSIASVLDEKGHATNYVSTITDISQKKLDEQKIYTLAFTDHLTNLPNRRLFLETLANIINENKESEKKFSVVLLDLDLFKKINDTMGHDFGDYLLKIVATRIESIFPNSTISRIDGDEFGIIVTNRSGSKAEAARETTQQCQELLSIISKPFFINDQSIYITTSIGVTFFGGEPATPEELLKQADIALYKAKGAGKNRITFFDPEMQEEIKNLVSIESELHNALNKNQLFLALQPQFDKHGHVIGMEALVRWRHPVFGIVSPGVFIPIAEKSGLMTKVGHWVMEQSFMILSDWQQSDTSQHMIIAINISPLQFYEQDFTKSVIELADKYQINPQRVKLEITESIFVGNFAKINTILHELKNLGFKISLDDFGTGYSCLSYLKEIPFDQIKIDQSFVKDFLDNEKCKAIIQALLSMASSLNIDIIAEGVEDRHQLDGLLTMGCKSFQGYYFSKPFDSALTKQMLEELKHWQHQA